MVLMVFSGFVPEEGEEESFLATTSSPGLFFPFSLFPFTLSGFTLAFTFWPLSFFVRSDGVFDVDLVEGLTGVAVLLEAGALEVAAPAEAFEDMGDVMTSDGISSIGSSLTGVASPRSTD